MHVDALDWDESSFEGIHLFLLAMKGVEIHHT